MLSKEPIVRLPTNAIACRLVHLHYICHRLREDEIHQYCVLTARDEYDPDRAAVEFFGLSGLKLTILNHEGLPAACGGYHEVFPGVWQSWMCGTADGWANHWRSITKGSRWMMDHLFDKCMARRLQTNALASRTKAIEWYIRGLGLQQEGVQRAYGRQGEDVAFFSKLAPVVED